MGPLAPSSDRQTGERCSYRQAHSLFEAWVLAHAPFRTPLPFLNLNHSDGISDLTYPPHSAACTRCVAACPDYGQRLRRPATKRPQVQSPAVRRPMVLTSLPSVLLSSEDPPLFAPVRQRQAQPCQIRIAAADCSLDSRDLPAAPLDSRGLHPFQADFGE
jgi:hypothetical protein